MHETLSSVFLSLPAPVINIGILFLIIVALFVLVLKVFAVWYSARAGQKKWFVALLVLNTAGILEIIYLIWFRPKTSESVIVPPKEELVVQS